MAAIDDISNLYVGYFNRAPDPAGLNFWVTQYTALGQTPAALAGIAQSFAQVPEATSLYGFLSAPLVGSPTSFLASLYLNLFNRVIDTAGSDFWVGRLNAGVPVGSIIQNIISGAQGDDALVVANKGLVAKTFAQNLLDNNAVFSSALAASALTGVTKDAATATQKIATNLTAIQGSAGSAGGSTFTLTTAVDNFTGTTAGDTFTGADTTLTAADTLNGGGGTDTLNYTNFTGGAALPAASISGIEVLNARAVGNAITAGDLSLINGLTTFNSDRSNAAITVTNLASGGQFGIKGDGSVVNAAAANFGSVAAATAQTLNISGGTLGTSAVTLTGTGVLATTVNSTGAANVIGAITAAASSTSLAIAATTGLTTGAVTAAGVTTGGVTISGAGAVTTDLNAVAATKLTISNSGAVATGVLNNATVTVDASTSSGGVTTTLGTSTAMVFKGGSGNDLVTAGAVLSTGAAVDAGAGTGDRVTFTANGQLTAASGAKYTNFEVLQSTGATDIDMANIAGIVALRTSGNATFTNVSATQAAAITTVASGNLNIGVKGASTVNQLDTVSITTSSTNAAVAIGTLAAADVETINLTASTGTGLTSITTFAHDDWSALNLSGASAITITSTATAALINTSVNGSAATGVLTLDFTNSTTNGISITGGSANDVLTATAQADVVTGGAGNDTLSGLAGADTISGGDGNDSVTGGAGVDSLTGGAGVDTFVFSTANLDTTAGAVTDTITDFVSGTDKISNTVVGAAGSATNYVEAGAAVADLATLLTAANTALDGTVKFYVGQVGSDSYLVSDTEGTGYTDVIKLTGVALTGIAFGDITA